MATTEDNMAKTCLWMAISVLILAWLWVIVIGIYELFTYLGG